MKKLTVKKSVFAMVLIIAGVAAQAQGTYYPPTICGIGQDDSTCGNGALSGYTPKIPLKYQELQPMGSPIINNVTNTSVTQVVQPNTYQVSGTGSGLTTATAQADCGGGTLLGGGGTCQDNQGLVAVAGSSPVGNSWVIGCQSLNYKQVYATANAICSAN